MYDCIHVVYAYSKTTGGTIRYNCIRDIIKNNVYANPKQQEGPYEIKIYQLFK
jgi:hypothetical protein